MFNNPLARLMEVLHPLFVVEIPFSVFTHKSLLQALSGQTEWKGSADLSVKLSLNIVEFSVICDVDLDPRANLANRRERAV